MKREFYGATVDAQRSVNDLLSLPATGKEQDWEFELADPTRIDDMLKVAKTEKLNYEQRCALYLLLIASMAERNEAGNLEGDLIDKAHSLLNHDPDVQGAMIFYWVEQKRSLDDELMRRILIG